MPSKSKTHEEAQRRVYRAELTDLKAARRKVDKDFAREATRLRRVVSAAQKALDKAQAAAARFTTKAEKSKPRRLAEIDDRIAIVTGRLNA